MQKTITNSSDLSAKRNTLLILMAVYFIIGAAYINPPNWIHGASQPILKAAPILLLAVWVLSSRVKRGWLIGIGLILSAAGDIALDVPSLGFICGMGLFAMAHIAYISCFAASTRFHPVRLVCSILFFGCIGILVWHLSQSSVLTDLMLRWMIYVYTAIISLMVITAIFYDGCGIIISTGAVVFAVSDSMIAWNRFVHPVINSGFLIMSTYYLAQYMIAYGYLKSTNCTTHNSTSISGVTQ